MHARLLAYVQLDLSLLYSSGPPAWGMVVSTVGLVFPRLLT